jgi:hypothetical protein
MLPEKDDCKQKTYVKISRKGIAREDDDAIGSKLEAEHPCDKLKLFIIDSCIDQSAPT